MASGTGKFSLTLHDLTEGLLATISFHTASLSLLGRMPPLHLLLISLVFLPGQILARIVQLEYLFTLDPGASASVQLYGAVFGVVSSAILLRGKRSNSSRSGAKNYIPSSVSLCGSFLLALSSLIINTLGVPEHQEEFVILNTCFIQSATITAAGGVLIGISSLKRKPLNFQLLQGSLIAGGVAAAAIAGTQIEPWGATALGIVTGVCMVLGGLLVEPALGECLGVPISYCSSSIHGLPALLGGFAGILMAGLAEEKQGAVVYGLNLYKLYPGRVYPPGLSSPGCEHINKTALEIQTCPMSTEEILMQVNPSLPTLGRSAADQATMQAVFLLIVIGLGVGSGILGGLLACLMDRIGGRGMPREAWYDSTCFLETSGDGAAAAGSSLKHMGHYGQKQLHDDHEA